MRNPFVETWVYGGFLAGWLLVALTPIVALGSPEALTSAYLLLPIYMLHQFEEHYDDRFRREINEMIGGGREVLTSLAVFVVNVPLLWGGFAACLIAAAFVNLGLALIPVYLTLVNAIVHIVVAIVKRAYNPGLVTGVVLFLPFGLLALIAIARAGGGGPGFHALGLVIAVGVHALIARHVLRARVRPALGFADRRKPKTREGAGIDN